MMIITSKIIFKPSIKKLKALEANEKLEIITSEFPENIKMVEEILDIIENNKIKKEFVRPKVEIVEDTKTSLYIAVTNKILIADMKNNYARIQTIAHECIHSSQNKALIFFNFIISNINILFFLALVGLTLFRVIEMNILLVAVLTIMILTQFAVRIYLEVDAMKKARLLAEEYINKKIAGNDELNLTKEDKEKLLKGYDKINEEGIPFMIDYFLTTALVKILIYATIGVLLLKFT